VRFRARARPPLGPPSLPRATACGFFFRGMAKPYCTVQDQRSLDLNEQDRHIKEALTGGQNGSLQTRRCLVVQVQIQR
jgi:hypothetical protein